MSFDRCTEKSAKSIAQISLLMVVGAFGGCSTDPERVAAVQQGGVRGEMSYLLKIVSGDLKPEHFAECDRQIEQAPPLFGGPIGGGVFKRAGEYAPSLQSACAAVGFDTAPVAAYLAPHSHIVDGKAVKSGIPIGCTFRKRDGKIEVSQGAPTHTSRANRFCANI